MSWFLNAVYFLLLLAASPILLFRSLVQGKYREGWLQKFFGQLPQRASNRPCLWFHAVSVGEVLLLKPVIRELVSRMTDQEIVITVTTGTGFAVAQKQFPDTQVCYFPLDFSWAVRHAIRRINPSLIVLVELELWPNFILATDRANVPITLINGRVSEHSYRRYRYIRFLMKRLLQRFAYLAVQNRTYAQRLIELGADPERIGITGSIKFDGIETDRANAKTQELRSAFQLKEERIFIAGSTQVPEEDVALDAWLAVRAEHPDVRLILVPRHKERFDEVVRLVERRGLSLIRRSTHEMFFAQDQRRSEVSTNSDGTLLPSNAFLSKASDSDGEEPMANTVSSEIPPVLLLDTLGELSACWGLADIAFVGGSLTNRGGQNMIEPAAYGAAVVFGPNTRNFRETVEALLVRKAARIVRDRDDLTRTVRFFLEHPDEARAQGRLAQQFVLSQQGATEQTVAIITPFLPVADRDAI